MKANDIELGFISLDDGEDKAEAECGCTLVRAESNTGIPAVFLCPIHAAAPAMFELLNNLLTMWGDAVDDEDADISGSNAVEALCDLTHAAQDILKRPGWSGTLCLHEADRVDGICQACGYQV